MLYASVGHGGASGYLMVLGLASLPKDQISATALFLNLVVAGTAFLGFRGSGAFSWRLAWPFLLGSVPFAFYGGKVAVDPRIYFLLLGFSLLAAGVRLAWPFKGSDTIKEAAPPPLWIATPVGAAIGVLSGIVGVGGGIFLSPIIVLAKWGNARHAAATSALFILLNSASGLTGRYAAHASFDVGPIWTWLAVAWVGGMVGTHIGAKRLPLPALRTVLAGVLLFAAIKLGLKGLSETG